MFWTPICCERSVCMSLTENLPKALTELKWRPLFVIKLDV
jgi:hypothetical protein